MPKGYIALTSILLISAIVLAVTTSVTLLSISEAQISLATAKSDEAIDFVESCTEQALLSLNLNNSLPVSINLPQGTCTVTTNSNVGTNWTFTISGNLNNYSKQIQVQATRGTQITINSWKQI